MPCLRRSPTMFSLIIAFTVAVVSPAAHVYCSLGLGLSLGKPWYTAVQLFSDADTVG